MKYKLVEVIIEGNEVELPEGAVPIGVYHGSVPTENINVMSVVTFLTYLEPIE
ncbi:hypothetical protein LCGC14_0651390 [marine sediment metagenome]|uniref:Uncharacterized protein n=1 Tax=marine sediment metagenome TaxID=412755 RepID=A0A0F9R1F9_9ZZZZ